MVIWNLGLNWPYRNALIDIVLKVFPSFFEQGVKIILSVTWTHPNWAEELFQSNLSRKFLFNCESLKLVIVTGMSKSPSTLNEFDFIANIKALARVYFFYTWKTW